MGFIFSKPAPTPTSDNDIFRFFDLPGEIRDRIYLLLLGEPLCPTKPDHPVTPKCLYNRYMGGATRWKHPMLAPLVWHCILQSPNWQFYQEARAVFFRTRKLSIYLPTSSYQFDVFNHLAQEYFGLLELQQERPDSDKGGDYKITQAMGLYGKHRVALEDVVRFRQAHFELGLHRGTERATALMHNLQRAMRLLCAYPRAQRSWTMHIRVNISQQAMRIDKWTEPEIERLVEQLRRFLRQVVLVVRDEMVNVRLCCGLGLMKPQSFYIGSLAEQRMRSELRKRMMLLFEEPDIALAIYNKDEHEPWSEPEVTVASFQINLPDRDYYFLTRSDAEAHDIGLIPPGTDPVKS